MLTYAGVCSNMYMLTYAHVCSRMLAYADVCYMHRFVPRARQGMCIYNIYMLTYAHVCSRMLANAICIDERPEGEARYVHT
jgi:hypothetical protein